MIKDENEYWKAYSNGLEALDSNGRNFSYWCSGSKIFIDFDRKSQDCITPFSHETFKTKNAVFQKTEYNVMVIALMEHSKLAERAIESQPFEENDCIKVYDKIPKDAYHLLEVKIISETEHEPRDIAREAEKILLENTHILLSYDKLPNTFTVVNGRME